MIADMHATPAVSRHSGRGRQWFSGFVLTAVLAAMSVLAPSSAAWGSPDSLGRANQPSLEQTAQRVTRDLTARGYEVTQGYPMLWTAEDCDRYTFPIMGFCGNDPDTPYVILAVKSRPDEFVDAAMVNAYGK